MTETPKAAEPLDYAELTKLDVRYRAAHDPETLMPALRKKQWTDMISRDFPRLLATIDALQAEREAAVERAKERTEWAAQAAVALGIKMADYDTQDERIRVLEAALQAIADDSTCYPKHRNVARAALRELEVPDATDQA